MQTGCYLYGIIQADDDLELGPIGLDHDGEPAPVHMLRVGEIGAVVSPHTQCRRVLPRRRNLAPHNNVLGEVMKTTTIVPVTFGHVAESEDEVRSLLSTHHDAFQEELARVDGCVEMKVVMRWDVDNLFAHLVDEDPRLRAMRDELFSPGRDPSHEERFALGQLFEQQHERERTRLRAQLVDELTPVAHRIKRETPREMDQAVQLALLVQRYEVATLRDHIEDLAMCYGDNFVFQVAGPWAPFSFVELSLSPA